MIKLFPVVMILWFLLTRRFRAAAWSIVAIFTLGVATLPFIGLTPWLDYPRVLMNLAPPVDTTDTLAPIVWLSTIVSPAVARVIVVVAMVVAVAWASSRLDKAVSFGVAVAASVLIAPALYHHYLAIFVLPLLLALRWAPPVWAVALCYVAMFGGEQSAIGSATWIVNRLLPTVGALGLMVILLFRGSRAIAPTTPASTEPA